MKSAWGVLSRILLVLMVLSIASCDDDDDDQQADATQASDQTDDAEETDNTPDDTALAFSEVLLLHFLDQEETVVIRNQQEWQDYLNRSQQYLASPNIDPNDPQCDFNTHMLIAHSFQPHDGCPWNFTGVKEVTVLDETIIVHGNIDSRYIPQPIGPINDCQVVNVHSGFGVCVEQSDMPVDVTFNWY